MSGVSFNNPYSSYVNQQTPAGPNDFYFTLAKYAMDNPATQTLVWTGATFMTGNAIRGAVKDVRYFWDQLDRLQAYMHGGNPVLPPG
jgi:hypothetical protein